MSHRRCQGQSLCDVQSERVRIVTHVPLHPPQQGPLVSRILSQDSRQGLDVFVARAFVVFHFAPVRPQGQELMQVHEGERRSNPWHALAIVARRRSLSRLLRPLLRCRLISLCSQSTFWLLRNGGEAPDAAEGSRSPPTHQESLQEQATSEPSGGPQPGTPRAGLGTPNAKRHRLTGRASQTVPRSRSTRTCPDVPTALAMRMGSWSPATHRESLPDRASRGPRGELEPRIPQGTPSAFAAKRT